MAKPTRSIPVCDGLTLEGADLVFAGRRSPILECARAAFDRAVPGSDFERELGHALGLHVNDKGRWVNNVSLAFPGGLGAAGWAAVLACDPGLADALRADDARAAGLVVVESLTRAAGDCPDPLSVVLAVAEAARCTAGKVAPHHARLLTVPHAVEVACWRPARGIGKEGNPYAVGGFADPDPAALAARLARLRAVRECEFRRTRYTADPITPTGDVLPAVRLKGGLVRSIVLRPASDSTLAWANATWRVCRAALAGPRAAAKPKAASAKDEQPVVVLVDGVVVGHGTMSAADLADLIRDAAAGRGHGLTASELEATQDDQVCPHCEHIGTVANEPCAMCNATSPAASEAEGRAAQADAFMADVTRRRDEAERLPGEQRYLQEIADGWKVDLGPVQTALARQLAAELLAGAPGAPRFVAVRDAVRAVKMPRLTSVSQHVEVWARALVDLAAREEAEVADAREGAILDALERETPGALGALLRCGEIADPWGALVALTAADAEAAAVRADLTRPAMVKRLLALQERATRSLGSTVRPHLRHEVETLVAVLRDERADCTAFLVPTFAEARRTLQNCSGTAVAVRQGYRPESWRVVSGSLLTLVRAGLGELQEREGVVTAEWSPPGLPIGDLTDALLEWAVQEWQAAGCEGAPPSMADALIRHEAANAPGGTARNNKRR